MNRNRQPAGTSVGGEFAPGSSGEVDDILDLDDEGFGPDESEATDFSRFGLTPQTMPDGLEEAWARHEAILDQKPPEDSDRAIARALGIPDDTEVTFTDVEETGMHTVAVNVTTDDMFSDSEYRQIAQSMYHVDVETSRSERYYDAEEATHRFAVPADDPVAKTILEADYNREKIEAQRKLYERERAIDHHVEAGHLGPWATMADRDYDHYNVENFASSWAFGDNPRAESPEQLERARQDVADHAAFNDALTNGSALPEDVARRHKDAAERLDAMRESGKRLDVARAARNEVQSLPEDSPLRRHLLTPPPSWQYEHNVNAGTRKRKQIVMRTVHPDAPIDSEVSGVERNHNANQKNFDESMRVLDNRSRSGRQIVDSHEGSERNRREARDRAWNFGWPDDGTRPPARPGEA